MTILSSLFCTQDQGSAEPEDGFVVKCNWVALFVPPTSKSTCMHLRSTLVRFTPCLAAMDAQLLSRCQPRFSCNVDNSDLLW